MIGEDHLLMGARVWEAPREELPKSGMPDRGRPKIAQPGGGEYL